MQNNKTFKTSLELLNYFRQETKGIKYKKTDEMDEYIKKCEQLLEYDTEGQLKKIYEMSCKISEAGSSKLKYLNGSFQRRKFTNETFDFSIEFLRELNFDSCIFENITLTEELKNFYQTEEISMFDETNELKNIIFTNNNVKYNDIKQDRIGESRYTCRVNLYVELDRICNAKCSFCRNNYYAKTAYDFKKIQKSFQNINDNVDTIVIGGGEPTLKYDELKKLSEMHDGNIKIISSNLSAEPRTIKTLREDYFEFLVSRHAIDMEENASIFGFNEKSMKNSEENLNYLSHYEGSTLSTVCFKDGINSYQKLIDYIEWGIEKRYFNQLIQTLHQEDQFCVNKFDISDKIVDTEFIKAVINYFVNRHFFKVKPAIYSTAGYRTTVINRGITTIAFKEYLTKADFEKEFPSAMKRTIDLSLAPDGTLYENWHQNSGAIELPKRKLLQLKRDL